MDVVEDKSSTVEATCRGRAGRSGGHALDAVSPLDPAIEQIVWQSRRAGALGTGPKQLDKPDGLGLLAPNNNTSTHPQTG